MIPKVIFMLRMQPYGMPPPSSHSLSLPRLRRNTTLCLLIALILPAVANEPIIAPIDSQSDRHVGEFHIPAPRGMIVASSGEPLAQSRVASRIVIQPSQIGSTAPEVADFLDSLRFSLPEEIPWLAIGENEIKRHLANRPWLPFPVSGALPEELDPTFYDELPVTCQLAPIYVRTYPEAELFAHTIGYIGDSLPDQHGPIAEIENLWPPTIGRAGLEKTQNEILKGNPGEINRLLNDDGDVIHEMLVRPPVPGKTVVLSFHLGMQRLARKYLEKTGRPGAFVAVDADTGDILALASYPSFDPNLFIGGISSEKYRALADHEDAPFFDRAVIGEYPPGSTFKPIVALAGMEWGKIDGIKTKLPGPAVMRIGNHFFKNWSSTPEGLMDVRYALMRSCNTWFYQVGMDMGAHAITDVSERFGLGRKPPLPLPAVSSGNLPDPENYNDDASLANYSIGQGRVLASPVQMVMAMAALANGQHVPAPRLIKEIRDPVTGETLESFSPKIASYLNLDSESIELVRDGMWGVVNHRSGTAGRASMRRPVVYGKTGTSEWAEDGEKRSLAWFTGWVDAEEPRIAFAAVTHGRKWDSLSGGRSAAPIAAGFLREAYAQPDLYAVTPPEKSSRSIPNIAMAEPIEEPIDITPVRGNNLIGRFFRGLFGKKQNPEPIIEPITEPMTEAIE